jgi:predicted transcriptional regulator
MDLQAEKLSIVQIILNTDDKTVIMEIKALLANRKKDWFAELTEGQQKDILEGLAEADRGETFSHSEVVKLFEKWGLR